MASSELTDHEIETILLAPSYDAALRFALPRGRSLWQVRYIREGHSRRGLRIGTRLGIFPRRNKRSCFTTGGAVVERPLVEVAASARHIPYGR